jgi:peptidoglycan hydrolase CwlO-like protein
MAVVRFLALFAFVCCSHEVAAREFGGVAGTVILGANPIRRVVTMLQSMEKKVAEEAAKEKDLFDKFMCYCKTGKGTLDGSIASATNSQEQLTSSIKETDATLKQTKADLKAAQTSRAEAKAAVASATSLREKEAAAYAIESGELKTNIAATKKASAAIEKGMGGAFLQAATASVVKHLSITMDISSVDRDMLTAFLTQGQGQGSDYVPASGQITGILKQMIDTMEKSLATATSEEKSAISDFDGLVAAKTKEINALTKSIESKTSRIGELGVELVTLKEDLEDTTKSLLEDTAFLKDLDKNCKTKADEWETRKKIRAEESLAIAETIKILNDDDALELFKKTLPSASLLQLKTNNRAVKKHALMALEPRRGAKRDFRLDLISLALKGKKVSFTKVLKMIDDMVALLGKEQFDDDSKKEYCEKLLDKTEDDLKALELSVSDLGKLIADSKERIATLKDELEALADGIKALDKQVAEATEDRKEEHAENVETVANDNAAKELIGVAKNRLNKFYNPKLYVAAPKRELSEEERITLNMGGTLAPTAAPGGIAGTGVTVMLSTRSGVAPPPPPETFGAYSKKGEESTGVITMLDMMVADLDKEITEIETEEKENQAEYEEFMKQSATKRASDSKSIEDKESAKADVEAALIDADEEKTAKMKEAMATAKYLSELHGECDWLMTNFETRKEARTAEIESLKNAKAVLSGADYSLLQSIQVTRHGM